jgi:hypothetical protein
MWSTRASWRTGSCVIPISVPSTYDALKASAIKGKNVGPGIACPGCLRSGGLVYTSTWVQRGSRWPGSGKIEDRQTPLPLCCCEFCRRRFRVLPVEIAPHKSYTLPVIETACAAYMAPESTGLSLKRTVTLMGQGCPHRSTLHGWLGGLGARALGRLDRTSGQPVAALIVESADHLPGKLLSLWTQPRSIPPGKYRSTQRRDRLQACARLFDAAGRLFPGQAYPWFAWEKWLQTRFHVPAWTFPARFPCTAIQQHTHRCPAVVSPACPKNSKGRTKGKNHGARSPP